jgi:DNA-directed RNA polymerase specialized sigma24 family protein
VAEVARLEGASEATVRSRVKAGLKRLSLSLDDLLPQTADAAVPLEAEAKGCGV